MIRAAVRPGAALAWLREAFWLINRGALTWAGLSCAALGIWLACAPIPVLREAVFVIGWVALVWHARRVHRRGTPIVFEARKLIAGLALAVAVLVMLGAFTRKALPESFAQAAPFIQAVGRYHFQAFDFLMLLALLEAWMWVPLILFGGASVGRAARTCLEGFLDLTLALEWMKAGAMFLALLLASLLVSGFLVPLVMAWMAAFVVIAYGHLYEK